MSLRLMRIDTPDFQSLLRDALIRHRVPGVSVAAFHNGIASRAAAGVTNVATGIDLTPESVMHIGSITKVFNATLVMQLVEEGRIDLDESVVRYVPELRLRNRAAREQITVRMLLDHTSGIDGEVLPDQGHDEETIEKAVSRFSVLGQKHRPGSEFSYCNPGAVLAGYLVQSLRKRSWYRVVRERIFEPLGMKHAVTLPEEALLHRASVGHFLDPADHVTVRRTSVAFLPLSFGPAGATLMMSAGDLIRFARAHLAEGQGASGVRILSANSVRVMQHPGIDNRGKGYTHADGMGLGWMVFQNGLLRHGGGGPGTLAVLYIEPGAQSAVAILVNAAHASALIDELMRPWLQSAADAHTPPVSNARDLDPDQYVGQYEDHHFRFHVCRAQDGLDLSIQEKFAVYDNSSLEPGKPQRLLPLGRAMFRLGGHDNASADAGQTIAFRNPMRDGRMQFLGTNMRLYPRV
jgi:CubicO group peptidase (beta-lactamase class C family)